MRQNERGVAMVIVAVSMVVLILSTTLVVDVGRLYVVRAQLQKAADAAALAGALSLENNEQDQFAADREAQSYASANLEGQEYDFTSVINPDNSRSTYRANLGRNVPLFFAPIIGIQTQQVNVSATAACNGIQALNNLVPFGVERQDFQFRTQYILKYGAGERPAQGGNYGPLDFGQKGGGGNDYRDFIKNGYQGTVQIGDLVWTEPGNMAGPTDQGVSYRKSKCTAGCSASTQIEANCPRVVLVPIIDALPDGGKQQVTVVGFAAFFLEETQTSESKGQKDVIGRFLKWTVVGDSNQGPANFGLSTVRLIQ